MAQRPPVSSTPELLVFDPVESMYRRAASAIARDLSVAAAARGVATIALCGGSTPLGAYEALANDTTVDWAAVHVFWGDERWVPPTHAESNFRAANEMLLSKIAIPPGNIHRVPTEARDPDVAAEQYEAVIRTLFSLGPEDFPRFDVMLLGLGRDGHTASLFPGSSALSEARRVVVPVRVNDPVAIRITLTPAAINHAASVIFLVSGESKAPALHAVLREPCDPQRRPAQAIRPSSGRLTFIVDAAAASLL